MKSHTGEYPIVLMCRVLKVSPSGYYAWRQRPVGGRAKRRARRLSLVRSAHADSRRLYGSPRVHAAVVARGEPCCVNTVARLMRENGLRARTKRKFKATTNSTHDLPVAENLLGRDFHRERPNEAWVSDITFIPTREGWLYLAAVEDLFSRRVVGWAMSDRVTAELVIDAATMAIEQRRPPARLIHHSDRGSQYCSRAFRRLMHNHGICLSMSRKADCYDNAVAESFFATLKKELIRLTGDTYGERPCGMFATRAEAKGAIFEYIEVYYNRQRRHSTLGCVSPAEFEERSACHT